MNTHLPEEAYERNPMLRAYLELGETLPTIHGILFARMGDFYEVFADKAFIVAEVCDLHITKRAGIPMCGVPYFSLGRYAKKLKDAGFSVFVSEDRETFTSI